MLNDTPAPLLRKIESLEQEHADIQRTIETTETATRQASAMREISERDVRVILNRYRGRLKRIGPRRSERDTAQPD